MDVHDNEKPRAPGEIPWWLRRLDLVRAELRQTRFPRSAEEGVRQCAALSAASMALFREQIRKTMRARDEEAVEREVRRVMARFSAMDERWKTRWKEARGTTKPK